MKKKQKTLRESIEELSKEEMADLLEAYVCLAPIRLGRSKTLTGKRGIEIVRQFYDVEGNEIFLEGKDEEYKQADIILKWLERD